MTWRDRYINASFKNVPFYVESHTTKGGVNISAQTNRYKEGIIIEESRTLNEAKNPHKITEAEISAVKRQNFNLNCYCIGADYDIDRNNLIEAITTAGSGLLIHPYLGEKFVLCIDWSITESTENGGIAKFNLSFEEDLERSEIVKYNLNSLANQRASTARTIATAKLLADKKISRRFIKKQIDFVNRYIDLANTKNIINRLELTDAVDAYFKTISTIDTIPTLLRLTKNVFVDNFIDNYLKLISLLTSMQIASESNDYTNATELINIKNDIITSTAIVANHIDDDELYNNLQLTKSYFIDAINEKNVADVATQKIEGELPWLVVTNNIYNNIEREQEIINLNTDQLNPLFYSKNIKYVKTN